MVADGLNRVRDRVAAAAARAGRSPAEVTIVAVSKGQPLEAIDLAYAAGQRHFGENRPQELAAKANRFPGPLWHLVGHLQRNKANLTRPLVTMLHSLDAVRTARAWASSLPAPPALVEVNLAAEPQKHGVAESAVEGLIVEAEALGVEIRGLMTIPPLVEDAEQSRPWFRRLALLRDRLVVSHPGLTELSMGMSDDFEVAIEEGATLVRVGRAIFGPRH